MELPMKTRIMIPAFALGVALTAWFTVPGTPCESYVISVTLGKAHAYSPHSNELFDWSGSVDVNGGSLDSLFKLTYATTIWERGFGGCSREYSRRLGKNDWTTEITPGSGRGLEGIRLYVNGNAGTVVTIGTKAGTARFTLGELLGREYLEFRMGGYYSYQPISVYLGPDARPRMSKRQYAALLAEEHRTGTMVLPDEFSGPKANFMSAYCSLVEPNTVVRADVKPGRITGKSTVPVKLQMMAAAPTPETGELETTTGWIDFTVAVGRFVEKKRHYFSHFRQAEKLYDLFVDVPSSELQTPSVRIEVRNNDARRSLLIHRVFLNERPASHAADAERMPPLPAEPNLWVGYDLNTTSTQDGEVDSLLHRMRREQMGNYVLVRIEENSNASNDDLLRWGNLIREFNFKATTTMTPEVASVLSKAIGKNFLGIHQHESSNMIYRLDETVPKEPRKNRTLPDCEAAYGAKMGTIAVLGQALPMCNLDYKSGVGFISSEFPTAHSTLDVVSNRGGAYLFDKPYWGVHLANHVMRMPDDDANVRRNFLYLWQSWLSGARLIYDEESAVYGIHSTSYSYSDPMTFNRRRQMQELYHYGSNIDLGQEIVRTGFLLGKYDCLVGGLQASPEMDTTKVWGLFGPETDAWRFNTPERGWELLDAYMPGVWLYPVPQDNAKLRMFLTGSPAGQVDLVTVDGDLAKLSKYELLVLPGWNTMTDTNYEKLIAYVRQGGHLVLAATQCTRHVTRDFLLAKTDFDFYRDGDLTALTGVKAGNVTAPVKSILWSDGLGCDAAGVPGLEAEVSSDAVVLARTESGLPILVEKSIGKGKVWTLVAGEYWGVPSLDAFRVQLAARLQKLHTGDISISGESRDIDYHVYRVEDGSRRVAFLNTDWTQAGNVKKITLHLGGRDIPLAVAEGRLVNVQDVGGLAVSSEVPGVLVRSVTLERQGYTLSIGGTGRQTVHLHADAGLRLTGKADPAFTLTGKTLEIDFGSHWSEKCVGVELVR
jgi:hypothetical protein